LSDIREELAKEIELKIDVKAINSFFVHELEQIALKHHGKKVLKLVIYDEEEQMMVDTVAKKLLVEASNEFFSDLASLDGIESRIISKGVEIKQEKKPAYKQYAKA
jgi:uncharacterized membrane-anchored protein YjiN (DUF445 family)